MKLLRDNWDWITLNPWGAASLAILLFLLGWGAARLFYRERLAVLAEQRNSETLQQGTKKFTYPKSGRFGRNILSRSTTNIFKDEEVSLRADVPKGKELSIELRSLEPNNTEQKKAAWLCPLGKSINWSEQKYQYSEGGHQLFECEEGVADKEIHFKCPGEIAVKVYEDGAPSATWSRHFSVIEPDA